MSFELAFLADSFCFRGDNFRGDKSLFTVLMCRSGRGKREREREREREQDSLDSRIFSVFLHDSFSMIRVNCDKKLRITKSQKRFGDAA